MSNDFLRDYLIKRFKSPQPPTALQAEFKAIGDRFAGQLLGKALAQS